MKQPYIMPTLYCQYHSFLYPGHLKNQGTSTHDKDQITGIFCL